MTTVARPVMLLATDSIAVTVFSYDVDRESIKCEMVDLGSEDCTGLGQITLNAASRPHQGDVGLKTPRTKGIPRHIARRPSAEHV